MVCGVMIVYFIGILNWLYPTIRRTKNYNARYVIRLLVFTMLLLSAKNLTRFVLDMYNLVTVTEHEEFYHHFARLLEMFAIPLMGMSLVSLVRLTPPRKTEAVSVLLPLVVCVVFFCVTADIVVYYMALCYIVIYSLVVILVVHVYAYRYHKLLNETYANVNSRGVNWVVTTLYILVSLLAIWLLLSVWLPHEMGHIVYYALSIIPWSFYAYRLMHHNFDVDVMRDIVAEEEHKLVRGLTVEEEAENSQKRWQEPEFGEAVMRYCSAVENFTNTNLSIMDVARGVGTNRTYVSLWCKEQGKDFSTLIADIRLDYAERMLAVNDYSITDVVEKSGFTSPRSFRTVFEARHNCTPTEYRARLNLQG